MTIVKHQFSHHSDSRASYFLCLTSLLSDEIILQSYSYECTDTNSYRAKIFLPWRSRQAKNCHTMIHRHCLILYSRKCYCTAYLHNMQSFCVHAGVTNIKHPLLNSIVPSVADLCQSWRKERTEDKNILLSIDSINGLDHPLIQLLLKPSFLRFRSEMKNGSYFGKSLHCQ